jgi:O-antigen/teichoic acid export membrane protein
MTENSRYSANKVRKKSYFNVVVQIIPICVALTATPFLIANLGKDSWAKYATGISLVFLSNYFSFGIGPTLNRRVANLIGKNRVNGIIFELDSCLKLALILGLIGLGILQASLYVAHKTNVFSILDTQNDYIFFALLLLVFLLSFLIIPFKSILESFSDFVFLGVLRAFTSSMLFLVPVFAYWTSDNILFMAASLLFFLYLVLFGTYLFRVKIYFIKMELGRHDFFSPKFMKGLLKFDRGFITESVFFGLFFICSAIVLFFDRFYYPIFYDTIKISDHVTLLDLFNRIAILTGTISLVYFSAISVWFSEGNIKKIKENLRKQLFAVFIIFILIIGFCYFFLNPILSWWLGESYSSFINEIAWPLLIGVLAINYTILLLRPIQAIGRAREVGYFILFSTVVYVVTVFLLGNFRMLDYHFIALICKAGLDLAFGLIVLKRHKLL